MSIAMIQLFKTTGLPPAARLVAYMLADHHNDDTGRCDPSIACLVSETGLSERGVRLQLRHLESAGHMTILARPGCTPLYRLHPGTTCPPAPRAPRHHVPPTPAPRAPLPRHHVPPTPAPRAPEPERTVREPEENQNALPPGDLELLSSEPIPDRKKKGGPVPMEEVATFCATLGLPASDAESTWHKWEGNGWKSGSQRIKDWRATIRSWKASGYMPSQKQAPTYSGRFREPEIPEKKIPAPPPASPQWDWRALHEDLYDFAPADSTLWEDLIPAVQSEITARHARKSA